MSMIHFILVLFVLGKSFEPLDIRNRMTGWCRAAGLGRSFSLSLRDKGMMLRVCMSSLEIGDFPNDIHTTSIVLLKYDGWCLIAQKRGEVHLPSCLSREERDRIPN